MAHRYEGSIVVNSSRRGSLILSNIFPVAFVNIIIDLPDEPAPAVAPPNPFGTPMSPKASEEDVAAAPLAASNPFKSDEVAPMSEPKQAEHQEQQQQEEQDDDGDDGWDDGNDDDDDDDEPLPTAPTPKENTTKTALMPPKPNAPMAPKPALHTAAPAVAAAGGQAAIPNASASSTSASAPAPAPPRSSTKPSLQKPEGGITGVLDVANLKAGIKSSGAAGSSDGTTTSTTTAAADDRDQDRNGGGGGASTAIEPCSAYKLDMEASTFGSCKCRHYSNGIFYLGVPDGVTSVLQVPPSVSPLGSVASHLNYANVRNSDMTSQAGFRSRNTQAEWDRQVPPPPRCPQRRYTPQLQTPTAEPAAPRGAAKRRSLVQHTSLT